MLLGFIVGTFMVLSESLVLSAYSPWWPITRSLWTTADWRNLQMVFSLFVQQTKIEEEDSNALHRAANCWLPKAYRNFM